MAANDGTSTKTSTVDWAMRPAESLGRMTVRRFLRDKAAIIALVVLIILVLLALGAGWIAENITHHDPNELDLSKRFEPPNRINWMGTDEIGRDVLTRLLYGSRISLGIGVLAAIVAISLGGLMGAVGGYFGGFIDDTLNAITNTLMAVPTIFLLILLAAFFRPTPAMIAIIVGAVGWMGVARLIRGGVLSVKARDYILAAQVVGADDRRIILRHILPNVSSTIIVILYIDIAGAILAESALSFLGLGVQPPDASWGNMLQKSLNYLFRAPFLIFPPGLAIFVTVLCLYVLGDGLRDALDPRLKES
jgi:peptide/nickel transport system permease protein